MTARGWTEADKGAVADTGDDIAHAGDLRKDRRAAEEAPNTAFKPTFGFAYPKAAALTSEVIQTHEPAAATRGLHVETSLGDATVLGDPRRIHRLVSNLVDNAIRHNITNGRVQVTLASSTTEATLTVTNAGPLVPPNQVSRLLQPFQRGAPDRATGLNRLGLGMSIAAERTRSHKYAHLELPNSGRHEKSNLRDSGGIPDHCQ